MRKKLLTLLLCTAIIFSACGHNQVEENETTASAAEIRDTDVTKMVMLYVEEDLAQADYAEDVMLIALVTMAEAEGECEEGQRLVIDTILNRVDSSEFPNTIYDVIYQPNQFSSVWNGRIDRCEVRDELCQLVEEELASRTNYEVIFFTAGNYGKYGTPLVQVGNHYFSSK